MFFRILSCKLRKYILIKAFFLFLSIPAYSEGDIVLKAGVLRNFPPLYSVSDNGSPEGFAIDTIESITEKAGFSVEYSIYDNYHKLTSALESGEIDIIPNKGFPETDFFF